MKKNRAFILFEVTLTIAILSLGLVFIVRSIGASMKVAKASYNYNKAMNLAYEKLIDLELKSQTEGLEIFSDQGSFLSNENFSWKYVVVHLSDENLGKLILDVSWKEGRRDRGFNIVTYIKIKD
ncbi:MAG: type II secretion system protein [Candidatus Omnitrophota bacterium]